jgi:hypothetical protein
VLPAPANATTCPTITIILDSLIIYSPIVNDANNVLAVQCYTRDGNMFKQVNFPTTSDVLRNPLGAKYQPNTAVASLTCGQSMSCTVGYSSSFGPAAWTVLADGGCWFDFRHFTTLSYQDPSSAWTCTQPPVQYTLSCLECTSPSFPWSAALALAGPPISSSEGGNAHSLNSVMIILAVSIVSVALILIITTMIVRHRRRAAALRSQQTAELAQVRMLSGNQNRRGGNHKPPQLYEIGNPTSEMPPEEYKGPIVVLHCGEGEQDEDGCLDRPLRWPQIALAVPESPAVIDNGSSPSAKSSENDSRMDGGEEQR